MVAGPTEAAVWSALAEIPDPELPVVSLVDLGVIREVRVHGEEVHVELTPTFMGCPALETMRDDIAGRIAALGGAPHVEVVLDDSWSTDRISADGRAKLAAAGLAPPLPRSAGPTTLLQLERASVPCPWCGSRETRLENLFGPTPCRSLRYCSACRQPFEHVKTI